ncbi:MAG: STAS domain-containing protein [Planctomycetota bacterium]|nr:STAS domain-containing protein [Planctomycetota bacterium]
MAKSDASFAGSQDLPDGVVATLAGEIDYSRSPGLRNKLLELVAAKKPARLVLDLSGVPYMDSSGVATLVELFQAQRRANAKLVLFGLQPKVKGIFEIARLNTVFSIAPDLEGAKKA